MVELSISKDLLLNFFVAFARFEYALKRRGYLENRSYASPDWARFALDLNAMPETNKDKILAAAPYIQANPPLKQVVKGGALDWESRPVAASQIQTLVESIKTVRNNLFHGGKFPGQYVDEPTRNQQLLTESLVVLQLILEQNVPLCKGLAAAFHAD